MWNNGEKKRKGEKRDRNRGKSRGKGKKKRGKGGRENFAMQKLMTKSLIW